MSDFDTNTINDRSKKIIKTSIIGIITNILLSGFKAVVGLLSSSIAIILDSVNNLSDALSSTITIIGTKLAGKKPDKKHPLGHGRVEYLSSMIIAVIILYAGITSLVESIKKIITPETSDYSLITLIIISVAVIVKIILGIYFKLSGKKYNSDSLSGSGSDAIMDAVISTATLVSALIFTGLSLEAYLAALISLFILKAGFDMMRKSISRVIGERIDSNLSISVKETISSQKNVLGVYDLILENYGPDIYMGSVHIEVKDTMTAAEIDELTRKIMKDVYTNHSVILSAVGIYAMNTRDENLLKIQKNISDIVHTYKSVIQMHGFYINKKEKIISFDIILDFNDEDRHKTYNDILKKIQSIYRDYKVTITMDIDVSD